MNFRRGTKERWNKLNPVLEDGQPGFERPNGNSSSNKYKLKIGDGHSSWTELPYIGGDGEGGSSVQSDWNQTDPTEDDYIKNKPTIPRTAADVSALPASTKYGAGLSMTIDSSFVIKAILKDQDNNTLGNPQTIELPLLVNGEYNSTTKEIELILVNGNKIKFSVADLVSGLQTEITSSNKLDSDLVDDTNSINKFCTVAEKSLWNNKQDKITAGTGLVFDGNTLNHSTGISPESSMLFRKITYDSTGHITGSVAASNSQLAAIDSGIDSNKVAQIATNSNDISSIKDGTNIDSFSDVENELSNKVDKVSGKQLSTEDYTTSDKNKLAGIASGAEVNVQPDWNQTDPTEDDYIKNKPTIPPSFNVDQVYDPTSSNAQAGVAVAQALNGYVKGTYDSDGKVTIPNVLEMQFWKYVPDQGVLAAGKIVGAETGIGNVEFSLPEELGGTLATRNWSTSNFLLNSTKYALSDSIGGDALSSKGLSVKYYYTDESPDGYSGSHVFAGSGSPWNNNDWVGLQIGSTQDTFQVTASSNRLLIRQNDANPASSTWSLSWNSWSTCLTQDDIIGNNGITATINGTSPNPQSVTLSHTNSVTAQTDYNKYKYKYDAQGHITSSSHWVHTANGTSGSAGWIKIASFEIIDTYFNTPVTLICSRRGNTRTIQISFGFSNANSLDPDLNFFELSCIPSCAGSTTEQAYLIKSETSKWDLYVLKRDSYEAFVVNDFIVGKYFSDHVTWTWKNEQVAASAITGGTPATNRLSLGMTYANNYQGMSVGLNDTPWIRTTVNGIIPYERGGANNGHSSLGTTDWRFKDAYIDEIYGTYFHGTSEYADKLNNNAGDQITPIYFANGLPTNCKTYASGATWNIVPRVQSDGIMEIGKYIDFHTANNGTTDYDIQLCADNTSTLSLQSNGGDTAFKITGTLPRIIFNNTTSGKEYSKAILTGYAAATYGMNLLLESEGNMIISSGGSGTSFYGLSNKSTSYPDYWNDDAEVAYLTSDSTIVLLTNCNTIANRKAFTFGSNFGLPPGGRIRFMHSDSSTASGLLNGANATTTPRTWTLPDETGTIALLTNTDANSLMNLLTTASATPTDDDYYISQSAGGGTTTTTYHRRKMLALYKYLCNKRTGYIIPDGSTVTGSANNWFRIAYSTTTGTYSDIEGIFLINYAYSNAICGILKVRGRTEGTAGTFGNAISAQWLVKDDGLDGNNICVIFANNKGTGSETVSGTACVEIWVKATARYQTVTCTMLSGFGRNATSNADWTWYMENNPGATGTTSLPTYSSATNVYATTEMGITAYDVTYKTPTPSAKVTSEWNTTAERTRLVTKGWMSYWNGAYNGTSSNLTYCNQGAFGTIVTHDSGDYVLKTGDTMSGNLTVSKASGDTYCIMHRTDTDVKIGVGVGSGGTNHGLYSYKLGKWMVYSDASNVYINAHKVPTLANSNVGVYKVLYTSTTAPSATSGSITALTATSQYIYDQYDIIKVWVYIGSTSMIQQVDICCTTKALAQAPHYFPTASSYNTKYLYFTFSASDTTYTSTLNWVTAGTSDSTKISIAKVIGVRFR